jgi:hypothetical protein
VKSWEEFVSFAFSYQELLRTFVAMLNTIRLPKKDNIAEGMGIPQFPIVSDDCRWVIVGWLASGLKLKYAELQRDSKKLEEWNRDVIKKIEEQLKKQSELAHEISTLRKDLEKEGGSNRRGTLENRIHKKRSGFELTSEQINHCYSVLRNADGSPYRFLQVYAAAHPELSQALNLPRIFTRRAASQIGWTKSRMANAIIEIIRLISWLELERQDMADNQVASARAKRFQLKPLLFSELASSNPRLPGDDTDKSQFCYVCGHTLGEGERAQVNRFIFESPSQRLQSTTGEKRPGVCYQCAAIAMVSPLKASKQSVIIKFDAKTASGPLTLRSAEFMRDHESFLRGLTLSQLDLAAGNYLMLTSGERVKVGKNWRSLSDVVGTVIYAHLRLADIFEHQVFLDYSPRIVAGISDIGLASHRLAFLSILIKSLQLRLREGNSINRPLTEAARHVLADEPVLAIYELVSQPQIDPKRHQEMVRIEIERSLEVWTTMIGNENRAKLIADVVAMAGLLYPFVDQTRQNVRKKNDPSLDPDREASKLIEEVDEVFNFIYRFADNSTYSTARLYSNPTNWFTYEQAKHLLGELGVDLSLRETAENTSRFLEVNASDVEAAYKHFAEGDYKGDADWRAFTYRLKLALYSRFPGLGVKKEKSQ